MDGDLAQDTLQETFIKSISEFSSVQNDSQLYTSTRLYRIATNEALQQVNKMKKCRKLMRIREYHMQNLVADNTEGDAEEIQILLQNAIQSLPEKQKLVFMMRYYDDLPYEEISKL